MDDKDKAKHIAQTIAEDAKRENNKAPIILTTSKQVGFSVRCEKCKQWEIIIAVVKDEHGSGIRFLCTMCKQTAIVGRSKNG